ncbi:sulfite exporter TauE/SafE family protein [bacterium]|nr:sulfite exporter TauE/SafE family protein [bacterium]
MLPEPVTLVFAALAVLFAGFVRGFSGFGFSMIVVISLSVVFKPAEIVPTILLLEVTASLWLLPGIWRDINWYSLRWLMAGVLVGTPVGVAALANIPAKPMQIAIAFVVIVLVLMLWRGIPKTVMPGRATTIVTGVISGIVNGGAAIGGPPVILYYFSSPAAAGVSRASLIFFFFSTDVIASLLCTSQGLMRLTNIYLAGIFLVPMIIGVSFGSRAFSQADPESFRKKIMLLLIAISIMIIVKATLIS